MNVQQKTIWISVGVLVLLVIVAVGVLYPRYSKSSKEAAQNVAENMALHSDGSVDTNSTSTTPALTKVALFGGGCFWCAEHDMEAVKGVIQVKSGYAGGNGDNPTYQNYAQNGYREVIEVTYDANVVSYGNLVENIIKHGDPTDPDGSFHDRGPQYAPAIYYQNDAEKAEAQAVIQKIDAMHVYPKALTIAVIPSVKFWAAEDYHQGYSKKNPIRYNYYRNASGRNDFIKKYWGDKAEEFTASNAPAKITVSTNITNNNKTTMQPNTHPWETYKKPNDAQLQASLTPLQYKVTQQKGTEQPFANEYDHNFADGIYVDILSGEPLYSSKDKFNSGTGWPSFVKPITPNALVLKEDRGLFSVRTEVRSRFADDHIGHVFDDGPVERGGKRYCMNSAALRFIPKDQMEKAGYGEYLQYI